MQNDYKTTDLTAGLSHQDAAGNVRKSLDVRCLHQIDNLCPIIHGFTIVMQCTLFSPPSDPVLWRYSVPYCSLLCALFLHCGKLARSFATLIDTAHGRFNRQHTKGTSNALRLNYLGLIYIL